MFWIPRSLPDIPAFAVNVEFGYWLHSGKIIYGRLTDAKKQIIQIGYIKKIMIDNLEELLKQSIILADKLYNEKSTEIFSLSKRKNLERE